MIYDEENDKGFTHRAWMCNVCGIILPGSMKGFHQCLKRRNY